MSKLSLEMRLEALERQVASLIAERTNGSPKKDWRRMVGMFTDNPGMLELLADAQKVREADRRKARKRYSKKRGTL